MSLRWARGVGGPSRAPSPPRCRPCLPRAVTAAAAVSPRPQKTASASTAASSWTCLRPPLRRVHAGGLRRVRRVLPRHGAGHRLRVGAGARHAGRLAPEPGRVWHRAGEPGQPGGGGRQHGQQQGLCAAHDAFHAALEHGVCESGQRAQSGGGGAKGDASSSADWLNGALERHWQVPYLCASVLGAFLSNEMSGNASVQGVGQEAMAFIGGFLMLFGSRIGGGCTSGHGIAGMPMLFIPSVVAVCSMFGAGILTALVMESQQQLQLQGRR
ncbi:unnamed protein product [Prorocentrum cordatum]|uniref:Sulphur transport domain-containing protein n=1 Tax=Prorocentrum cordatum TaxID=2364126 RepID=A0ABN9XMD2_9DINO|nr:unnamed protein product [Polarella glacialis]